MKKIIIILFVSISAIFTLNCKKNQTRVIMKTSMGDIHIELFNNKAPETVRNFLNYIDTKFYNGTIFHRVIDNFMIQTGGLTPEMIEKETEAPIKNEADNGLKNKRGTLAMARTNQVNSATSQFFVNVVDNPYLDHGAREYGYCVFGRVIKGMDVVDRIRRVPVQNLDRFQNVPVDPVIILSLERVKPKR